MKHVFPILILIFLAANAFALSKVDIQKKIEAIEKRSQLSQSDYMQLGELAIQIRDLDKAVMYFKKANDPQNDLALDKLAQIFHVQKNNLEEIRALELIHVDGKASPPQMERLGAAYTEAGKIKEAVDVFRECIRKNPKYEKAYTGLYDLFMKNSRYDDARLLLMEIIDKFGTQKHWLNEYCRVDFEQKYFEDAKNICQKAILEDPQTPDNHVYLALSFKATGNDDQARKILFKAARQFKNSELTQWNAGQLSEEIENWEQAERQYDYCIEADSHSGRCFLHLGKVLFQLKKYDLALRALTKACPYEKSVDVEIRKLSYNLDKINDHKRAKMYMQATDKCDLVWFDHNKTPQK